MKDAQRYRMNAAECLSAAERCELPYRGLALAVAASWLSLARQQEAMDELLTIWSNAHSATEAAPINILPTCTALSSRRPLAVGMPRRVNAAARAQCRCLPAHNVETILPPTKRRPSCHSEPSYSLF
jgi:hypothetical protein